MGAIKTPPAPEVARAAELEEPALALLSDDVKGRAYVEALRAESLHNEAIRFLAHALPPRAAVWWAWGCSAQAVGDPPPPQDKPCIETVRAWLSEPTDVRRRAAGEAGHAVKSPGPAALTAIAAFMSEGSQVPATMPDAPAPPGVSAKLAAAAIVLASLDDDPEVFEKSLDRFLTQGLEVARKSGLWPDEFRESES